MAEKYHQTQLLSCSLPPEEQVFSNHVLLGEIGKHLSTQDLIRTSILSQAWFTESRKALTNSRRRHAVCIQIDYHSPCRTLVKFNDFLEETLRTTDHPIIFNGIKLRLHEGGSNLKHKCYNCLKGNWPAGAGVNDDEDGRAWVVQRPWSDEHDQLIMDKLPEMFGNILGKMELKYIHLNDHMAWYCPFAILIKWWIRERPESILELHFNENRMHYSESYVLFNTWYTTDLNNIKTLSNLEVFGIAQLYVDSEGFGLSPIVAPSLKKVILSEFIYDPARSGCTIQPNFPRHVFTNLETSAHKVKTTVAFINEFHPKIEVLKLKSKSHSSLLTTREDLFSLGRLLSPTLKKLQCSSPVLVFLVRGMNASNDCGSTMKNRFPALEILELKCSVDVNGSDWFNCIDFRHDFPALTAVRLKLVKLDSAEDTVAYSEYGPDNSKIGGENRVELIKTLILITESINRNSIDSAIIWLNSFRNISHLDLKGMPFNYDCDDAAFRRLISKIETLKFLTEISISSTDLSSLCLDDLILGLHSETKERLREMNLERLLVYSSSIFDHTRLNKINIHGEKICTQRLNEAGVNMCKSNQSPDTFLVSSEIAQFICKHRPGFKFSLEIIGACIPECTSGFGPGGLRLEHLEPFAKISTQQQPGIKFKRFWEIQFSKEDQENVQCSCSI